MMLRTMIPRTRLEWVEKLAGAVMWIAIGASVYLASARPGDDVGTAGPAAAPARPPAPRVRAAGRVS